ncbi:GGDEF domain-containing protein [Paenibacillus kobensis]|uniref:GGDEF domain-containing protein n=1 Tax=Paenibacillus kobensis TaxID=59841 RepID=UPI0013E36964|nr:GGDEF domain-containing protein [Paenibacillus kobensis]
MNYEWLQSKHSRWNRLLLIGCWVTLVLSVAVRLAWLPQSGSDHWMRYIIVPTAVQLFILIASEIFRVFAAKRILDYGIILSMTLFGAVYAYVSELPSISLLLLIPILASTYYCSSSKLTFAAGLSLVSMVLLNWNSNYDIGRPEAAGMTVIVLICSYLALHITKLGQSAVQKTYETERMYKELLAKTALMEKLVKTDALTELYNHITFHEYLDHLVIHHESSGMPLHLALLDIDNFKQINDLYGHRAGDAILRRVSELIRNEVRGEDIAARYGGEEFAILLSDTPLEQTYEMMERIRVKVASETYELLDGKKVTLSIGIARYHAWEGKESFFTRSDAALYMAKNSGKNRIVCADDGSEGYPRSRTTSA